MGNCGGIERRVKDIEGLWGRAGGGSWDRTKDLKVEGRGDESLKSCTEGGQ